MVDITKPDRLSWDSYFMQIAHLVSERATCTRAKIGAVIVRDRSIISTGYNGSPIGMPHCTDDGCLIYTTTSPGGQVIENCFRTIHAEINAIAQAAKHGNAIDKSSIYITASPCIHCLKVLINSGISTIYYDKPYHIENIEEMLSITDTKLHQVST